MYAYIDTEDQFSVEHGLDDPDPVFAFLVNSTEEELMRELKILEDRWTTPIDCDAVMVDDTEYTGPLKWWRPRGPVRYYETDSDPDANDFPTVGLLRAGLH